MQQDRDEMNMDLIDETGSEVLDDRGAADGFVAWALAGSNHHSSSTPGHFGEAVSDLARFLGIGCERVS
jgi:L-arabinose isomerase